jgi:lipoprotein-releasing system permease protein
VFELSILWKYLIPKKGRMSMTLITLMSVTVISLVVWLIVFFLSIMSSIEKGWLEKLTSLHAPIKITPTEEYFSSYHYLVDTISEKAGYTPRNFQEKIFNGDVHNPKTDVAPPPHWKSDNQHKDPVQVIHDILKELSQENPDLSFQDFEIGGALLQLHLLRSPTPHETTKQILTAPSYLISFTGKNPCLKKHLLRPSPEDIIHFLSMGPQKLSSQITIKTVSINQIPPAFLPENTPITAEALHCEEKIIKFIIGSKGGVLKKIQNKIYWNGKEVPYATPIYLKNNVFSTCKNPGETILGEIQEKSIFFKSNAFKTPLQGRLPLSEMKILEAEVQTLFPSPPTEEPVWPYQVKNQLVLPTQRNGSTGIVLAKKFYDNGVRIGDTGFLSYTATTTAIQQEQQIPITVCGFYNPGIVSIGSNYILTNPNIIHLINTSSLLLPIEKTTSSGFFVWIKNIKQASRLKDNLIQRLTEKNIQQYWKISTYNEFDFVKEMLQQFQNDKNLFLLIGGIILIVACSNIISLLVIVVNDKKREIGVLQALGASKKSITFIFCGLGAALGLIGSLLGICTSVITLHYLDGILKILSFFQEQLASTPSFYTETMSKALNYQAIGFVLIITPVLSITAAIIPTLKACRLSPSTILRGE